ncbi:hypothetical protein FB570_111263 [Streptomyces sp. T12]|uniref:hypothetical protein n=1 Tax=Streptomyces sp. T12 TaxID=477697 RepID=UPI0011A489F0|nr:hypothetical protein [Streptomyces sp. T12]TWD17650.1 hypothetical protein FB570_111263 [Streptomyces sp. T12]
MSSLSTRAYRRYDAGERHPARAETRRRLRRRMVMAAGAALLCAALLTTMTRDAAPNGAARWVSGIGRRIDVHTGLGEYGQGAAHVLSGVHSVAHWPLMALTLLWLGRRHQALYSRGALALLLSSGAGFAVLAVSRCSAREATPVSHYLETPGARAGWYVLMALALSAAAPALWARAGVLAAAAVVGASVVLTAENRALSVLLAGALPLLAWHAAAFLLTTHRFQRAEGSVFPQRIGRRTH